mmetsp:Transcript_156998/g.285760  ORF Transcript_156998/g.285760 Transcript_156998/m.285760 type:complete len:731 (-) Transcript_156998:103-2295(-)
MSGMYAHAPPSMSATPVWDVRRLPSSQGPPPLGIGVQHQPQAASGNLGEELANKVAEVDVLRKRLQQFERENSKMKTELAVAKDQGGQQEKNRQMQGEVDRLHNELRWKTQDLMSSEAERKRLHSACQSAKAELLSVKSSRVSSPGPPPLPAPAQQILSAPAPQTSPAAPAMQPLPAAAAPMMPAAAGAAASAVPAGLPAAVPTASASASTVGATFTLFSSTVSPTMTQAKSGASAAGTQSSNGSLATCRVPVAESQQWRQDVLVRELACWEAAWNVTACSSQEASEGEASCSWFTLREAVSRLSCDRSVQSAVAGSRTSGPAVPVNKATVATADVAAAIAIRMKRAGDIRQWAVARGGARFIQVWVGLFPDAVSELKAMATRKLTRHQVAELGSSASGMELFTALIQALHAVVIDEGSAEEADACQWVDDPRERHACAEQLLKLLLEVVSKLRPNDLHIFASILERPSLSALLAEPPHGGSLHLPCMRLLQALVASAELFARVHQTDSDKNPLLAAANLLIIPAIDPDGCKGPDSMELQRCRVAALELFSCCLASAPRRDIVLQLRGAPTINKEHVDTVLQRVVFLCHHELLCLGLHGSDGGPWHDPTMRECARIRWRAVEHALMIMSSFVWHAAPWTPDAQAAEHKKACSDACTALGRMRPLLASIVDMVVRRAQDSMMYTRLLSSASALRVLLAGIDGECNGCCENGVSARSAGHRKFSTVFHMEVA